MSKPGYTQIIVKASVRSRLQELARLRGYRSISQLENLLAQGVYSGVNPNTTLTFRSQFSEKLVLSPVFEKSERFLEPPPGFEPGIFSLQG